MTGRDKPPGIRRGLHLETGVAASAAVLYAGRRVFLGTAGLKIGRGDANDVVVAKGKVSREHARVDLANGGCLITDLGTRNGTFVNGERVRGESRPLVDGDTVEIGGETLRFRPARRPGSRPASGLPSPHRLCSSPASG